MAPRPTASGWHRCCSSCSPDLKQRFNDSGADRLSSIDGAALVVDALLGTGLKGAVTGPYATIISALTRSHARVLAVDIPSGLDADTGEPLGVAVRAEKTVTFQYPKIGFKNPAAAQFLGELIVADIGIPGVCVE